ncbi:MAG TPA: aspartate kinase, partial [Sphingobacteriaceae bacterium]
MTEVFKFGGASVKDAAGVRNVAEIVALHREKKLLIVVSAMGKTTNALEELTEAYVNHKDHAHELLENVKQYHQVILDELFALQHPIHDKVANLFVEIDWVLEDEPHDDYDFNYDQIVSVGELVSSKIISSYLNDQGLKNAWVDARSYIQTDNTYREGKVNWEKTSALIEQKLPQILEEQYIVTQGFIGGTSENFTTTLGREGSDYSAAIFASCLPASSVTIWKDVPGVLNADPKLFADTQKYGELPYSEAIEMAYYGASIIHPKTLKPLQNARIPLFVRPFSTPQESGTVVKESTIQIDLPAVIVKHNQVLISLSTKDLSFITEDHLSSIFRAFAQLAIKVNVMQSSALSFSASFDWNE